MGLAEEPSKTWLPYAVLGDDYFCFEHTSGVNWTNVAGTWDSEKLSDLTYYGCTAARLGFTFNDPPNTLMTYNEDYMDEVLDRLDSVEVKGILLNQNDYDARDNGYFGSWAMVNYWGNLTETYDGDSRVAGFNIWGEPWDTTWATSGPVGAIEDAVDIHEFMAYIIDYIRDLDSDRTIFYPVFWAQTGIDDYDYGDRLFNWTAFYGDLETALAVYSIDPSDNIIYDIAHPYFMEDGDGALPNYDHAATAQGEVDWLETNIFNPAIALFGNSSCWIGETYPNPPSWHNPDGEHYTEAAQEAFITALLDLCVEKDVGGIQLWSYWSMQSAWSYDSYDDALENSMYMFTFSSEPTPTPPSTPTPTTIPTSNIPISYDPFYTGVKDVVVGSGFQIYCNTTHNTLAFDSQAVNYTFQIEVLTGEWNGTDCYMGITNRGGYLYFDSNSAAEIQVSHNNEKNVRLEYQNLAFSTLSEGHSWNGTIPDDTQDCYLRWSFPITLPWEEDWMLWIGLFGLILMISGLLLGAYSFKNYPIFSFTKETIWETSLLIYSFCAVFIGFGLVMTWLLS